jgi:hypothetical protein
MVKIIIATLIFIILATLFVFSNTNKPFDIRNSQVAGKGIFAVRDHKPDEQLFLAIYSDETIEPTLASKLNHCPSTSKKHNSRLEKIGDEWFMVSNRFIKKGEEITTDYNDTPDFIAKPDPNWRC